MSYMPKVSNFPAAFDNDQNLFLVRDALRVRLLEDYKPGDASIFIEGDEDIISRFPPTGIITLTEQCSEIDLRAISFYYNLRTSGSFDELEMLPGFEDVVKPKRITNVTMNVVDGHHNHLKDTLVQIQSVLGDKYDEEDAITGRLKNLSRVMFKPKAWFIVDKIIGKHPLKVNFSNRSLRVGSGKVTQVWDFGDGETKTIITQNSEDYADSLEVEKTYNDPGIYDVSLKVSNDLDEEDEVVFEKMISVRTECPEEAVIQITPTISQNYVDGTYYDPCASSSTSTVYPKIRSVTNNFIRLEVPEGRRSASCPYSYAGEFLTGSSSSSLNPIDPVTEWTWSLGDDLSHANLRNTSASYSTGGYYDIVLRVDTQFGSFRITKYENSIDIIESTNLWLFNFSPSVPASSSSNGCEGSVLAYEFGLNSETFKLLSNSTLCVTRNDKFLSSYPLDYDSNTGYDSDVEERSKREFKRNVEFVRSGSNSSGDKGNSMLFWASGGYSSDEKKIYATSYNAFADQYESLSTILNRPWNWVSLAGDSSVYFLFGQPTAILPDSNNAFAERLDYDLQQQSPTSPVQLDFNDFENGAGELLSHPTSYSEGLATNGYFAVYRSAWKDSTGYILRNTSVGTLFRISSFYKTKGSFSEPYSKITKLPDMIGSAKLEAQMVSFYNGIYVFNNTGEICAWNDTTNTWEVGRANSASLSFRSLQDSTISGFDNRANTLLAASDGDRTAYLSYDYSTKAFIKFNGTDLTFSALKQRPAGEQFKMGVY
jgi:PKD repeat protein